MKRILLGLLPIVLVAVAVAIFLAVGTPKVLTGDLPPVEEIDVQRTVLKEDRIILHIVNDGPDPVTVAQLTVNEAFWNFEMTPDKTLGRLEKAKITIDYPWTHGDPRGITLITSNGVTKDVEIEVATLTPSPNPRYFAALAVLGVFIGVVPVSLGLLWFPFLKRIRKRWMDFFLALTVGLLLFLGVDSIVEAIEISAEVPESLQGIGVLVIGFVAAFLGLYAASGRGIRKQRAGGESYSTRLFLAYSIALGIGVHNLGEGLAIGGAYAVGNVALGTLLVVGFMIHNVTEGIAIVSPVSQHTPGIRHFIFFGLIGGAPAIIGTWIGGFAYTPLWAVFFLAVGAGAIFQVIVEIAKPMVTGDEKTFATVRAAGGVIAGLLVMYGTGLLIAA